MLPQYVEIVLQTKDLEEQAFITKAMYQTMGEHRAKHNTPIIIVVSSEM